ncbi:MAG TPA: glycosyltransferase [Bacteroidales bacterium]|nr:glycosyltransferase [Bacteroidales bacterium]HPM86457.1 glycosyltransferase [Bacteroidales bacterium]HQM68164.1 glycosyltransferase [Bacteroidales bacterium]
MIFQENLFLSVVFIVFALSAAVQLFYYLRFYYAVPRYRHPQANTGRQPVSVIICARNEAENLRNFLPSILEQDYPDFEVIVVDDCSEDETYSVLGSFLLKYPGLKISTVSKDPRFTHNKKFAQFIGIKAASNEILLFTDSDCKAASPGWITGMASNFDEKTELVLGYSGYMKREGLLNKYIRYDTFMIALQYLGMAIRGIPYMGVGRNMAYRKSLFFRKKGFEGHTHVISGDDDLFVNANATGTNTRVDFRKDSHTMSLPCTTLKDWIIQKKRHFTAAPYYKTRHKFLIITEPLTRMLFYISFIILMIPLFLWQVTAAIFGIRFISQIIVLVQGQKILNEKGIAGYSLFFDIFSPVINSVIFVSNTISRSGKNKWK